MPRSRKVLPVWAFAFVAALGGGLLSAISIAEFGPGASPDSASYIAGARNLALGDGYLGLGGDPIVVFPPGLSFVLSIGVRLGVDAPVVAGWANVLFAAGASFVAGLVIVRNVKSDRVRWLSLALLVFSVPMLTVSMMVWSETLFIFLTILSLILLARSPGSGRLLTAAGVLAGFAFTTRYIGITVVLSGLLWIWFRGERGRVRSSLWYGGSAGAIILGLLIRNYLVAGSLSGNLPGAANSLLTNLKVLVASMERWFLPDTVPLTLGVFILAPIGGYLLWRVFKNRVWFSMGATVGLFSLFTAVYVTTLLSLELIVNIDPPTIRFLSPIYLPMVVVGSAAVDTIWRSESQPGHRSAALAAAALLALGAVLTTGNIVRANLASGPGGYLSPRWENSEMVAHVKAHSGAWQKDYERVFSNDPWVTYLQADLAVELVAEATRRRSNEPGLPIETMCPDGSGESLLIWYETRFRPHHYTPEQIGEVCRIEPLLKTGDGTVYIMRSWR